MKFCFRPFQADLSLQGRVLLDKHALAEAPAYVGNLVIEDWIEGSAFNWPVWQARLLIETQLILADIIPRLFELVVITAACWYQSAS